MLGDGGEMGMKRKMDMPDGKDHVFPSNTTRRSTRKYEPNQRGFKTNLKKPLVDGIEPNKRGVKPKH